MVTFGYHYVEGSSAWGQMTGKTARFCEMDCYVTPWIVEFINTSTNLGYMLLGLYGYLQTRKHTKDSTILFCHALHILVGFGSTAYHLNVKYLSQMADEIAMFLLTNTVLYSTLSIPPARTTTADPSALSDTVSANRRLKLGVSTFTAIISAVHYKLGLKEPFEAIFISLVTILVARCTFILSNRVSNPAVKAELKSLLWGSTPLFILAIAIQKLDFVYCAQLTALRAQIGWPLGFLTELHGWWHLLTALSVHNFIVFVEYLRAHITEQNDEQSKKFKGQQRSGSARLVWKSVLQLPRLGYKGNR